MKKGKMTNARRRGSGGRKVKFQRQRQSSEKVKEDRRYENQKNRENSVAEENNVVRSKVVEIAKMKVSEFVRLKEEYKKLVDEELAINKHLEKLKVKELEILERMEKIEKDINEIEFGEPETKEVAAVELTLSTGEL